ncbi:MAG: hypothetical protein LBF25_03330 [Puniceicoccales bacterium]|jgi:hypothetical protein|nr:hypothetical protein [Puniceicoccales bacterium]
MPLIDILCECVKHAITMVTLTNSALYNPHDVIRYCHRHINAGLIFAIKSVKLSLKKTVPA